MKGKYDRYDPFNSESGLSQCPWCGNDIAPTETVVRIDGKEGREHALTMMNLQIRVYHHRCLKKRNIIKRAAENRKVTEWAELPED